MIERKMSTFEMSDTVKLVDATAEIMARDGLEQASVKYERGPLTVTISLTRRQAHHRGE